jgi:hypothetical protein
MIIFADGTDLSDLSDWHDWIAEKQDSDAWEKELTPTEPEPHETDLNPL